ncbi:hypothetical protein IW261DRAFT_672970 [Armillaria novae-zelandiae]|uniref:Uncharacterized protein n=1 Tax=Armillaria novae-zelandiae TaxID=153914 RepID=A0AA39UCJ0_9AGAR|nr:hypothetical protein IW261DRAFT_672970 [Armillaria novae-zelandiae]
MSFFRFLLLLTHPSYCQWPRQKADVHVLQGLSSLDRSFRRDLRSEVGSSMLEALPNDIARILSKHGDNSRHHATLTWTKKRGWQVNNQTRTYNRLAYIIYRTYFSLSSLELIVENTMSPAASQLTPSHILSDDATYADSLSSRTSSVRGYHHHSMSGSSDETMVTSPEELNVKVASNKFRIKAQRSLSIRSAATTPAFLRLKRSSDVDRPPSPSLPSPVSDGFRRQRSDSAARKFVKTAGVLLRLKSVPKGQGEGNESNDPTAAAISAQTVDSPKLPLKTRSSRTHTASHVCPKIDRPLNLRRPNSFTAFVDIEVEEDSEEDEVAKEARLVVAKLNRRWIRQECQCPYDKKELKACVVSVHSHYCISV